MLNVKQNNQKIFSDFLMAIAWGSSGGTGTHDLSIAKIMATALKVFFFSFSCS